MRRLCTVADCDRSIKAKDLCNTHYNRLISRGTASPDVPIRTSPGSREEFIRGVVLNYEGDDCIIWPFSRNKRGYGRISRDGKQHNAHHIVCMEAHGEPPSPSHESAHSCGRGHEGCVTKRHLRWATRAENHADKIVHDTHNRGERHARSKLTDAQAAEIRERKGQATCAALAQEYGVAPSTVCDIQNGKRYG